jgi:hypothetical protein
LLFSLIIFYNEFTYQYISIKEFDKFITDNLIFYVKKPQVLPELKIYFVNQRSMLMLGSGEKREMWEILGFLLPLSP